ncbi:hypothetical protein ACFL96_16815, partial [Thermoproteota archaeon]
DILTMQSRSDHGVFAGYAYRKLYGDGAEVTAGFRTKVFHRELSYSYLMNINTKLDDIADIYAMGFQNEEGNGFALDFSLITRIDNPTFKADFGIMLENVGVVFYDDNEEIEKPSLGLGGVYYPLQPIGNDSWGLVADAENIQENPALQIGTFYAIGNGPIFIPRLGMEVNGRNMFREAGHERATAGLSVLINDCGISGAFEYDVGDNTYRIGTHIWLGF